MGWLSRLSGVCGQISGRRSREAGDRFHGQRIRTVGLAVGAVSAVLIATVSCGNQYRPVVTPINPTGPAALPSASIMVVSQPGLQLLQTGSHSPCPNATAYSTPSVFTLLNFSGDSIVAQANGGNGPLTFSLDASGSTGAFAPNCDGTLTTAPPTSTSLLTKNVLNSTLLVGSEPTNTLLANGNLYVTEIGLHGPTCLSTNCVAQLTSSTGGVEALKQEIPVAPSLINLTGYTTGERIYTISQGTTGGTQPAWGDCDNPSAVTATGEADAIETNSNTISARLPLGKCPVYGFMTQNTLRTFIMNRGSGNVTVINSQLNAIDQAHPTITLPFCPGTAAAGFTCAAGSPASGPVGPVYADYYQTGQILVTANYDANTISIIDVSLDALQNDSATFGTVLATVPVGLHPVEVAVLQDGSRVYVANQGDIASGTTGSVSVVNLTNYTVEKTIPLTSNPHAIAAIYNYPIGKVYVASQNSPFLTVIRTDTDIVSATPEVQGNIVDMRVNTQYPGQSSTSAQNYQTESRSVGSGAP